MLREVLTRVLSSVEEVKDTHNVKKVFEIAANEGEFPLLG